MSTITGARAATQTNALRLDKTVFRGALIGMAASVVMAMYAMIAAATYLNSGIFTPLYHIATSVNTNTAMMTSMQQAMAGDGFTFAAGPALTGAAVHMITGAMYGVIFAIVARALRLQGAALLIVGIAFGFGVFAVSSWIALPLVASMLGGGDPIYNMASMVGYPTFLLEHVLFGLAAALLLARTTRNAR